MKKKALKKKRRSRPVQAATHAPAPPTHAPAPPPALFVGLLSTEMNRDAIERVLRRAGAIVYWTTRLSTEDGAEIEYREKMREFEHLMREIKHKLP